jgi:hypothetical protein
MRTALTATAVAAIALAGCSDPYAGEPPRGSPAGRATAAATPTPGSGVGDALPAAATPEPQPQGTAAAARGASSPAAVARAHARALINWEWDTLPRQLERARALAAGPLRGELARLAAATRADESLRRDRLGSSGRVVSVAVGGGGATRRLVVVTSEQALRAGRGTLEGARAKVYTATARRTDAGWRIVAWELEP